MTFEYAVCPHCGCRCEDDEFCAACGKLFHDDPILTRDVSVLGVLGSGLRSLFQKAQQSNDKAKSDELLNIDYLAEQADQELDASWSTLSSNRFHDMKHG